MVKKFDVITKLYEEATQEVTESPLQTLFCLRLSHQMHLTRLLLQVPVVLLTHSTKKLDEPDACIFLLWYQIHQSNISALSDWNSYQIQQFLWNPVLPTVQTSHSIFQELHRIFHTVSLFKITVNTILPL